LHNHKQTTEYYFVLRGNGILYVNDEATEVGKGAFLKIPKEAPHKLRNHGEGELEHLVFAAPPFNPKDVFIIKDDNKEPKPNKHNSNKKFFRAIDGALVYELDSSDERKENGFGIAYGKLSADKKALKHLHRISDEVYYVVSGRGNVHLDNSSYPISTGSVVFVPTNIAHALENTSREELEVLCLSNPPYQENDLFLVA